MIHSLKEHLILSCLLGSAIFALCPVVYAFPPATLADAVVRTQDVERRRVPLLIIGAEDTRPSAKSWDKLPALYPSDDAMPPLKEVLAAFDRHSVSCGTVQVVAPLTQSTLNTELGAPEQWAKIGAQRAAKVLFTSLSEAQWRIAAGPNGLGIADLSTAEQRACFVALFPDPFVLRQVLQGGGDGYIAADTDKRKTIAPEQVRLRIFRKMSWAYKPKGEDSLYGANTQEPSGRNVGDPYWIVDTPPANGEVHTYREKLKRVLVMTAPNRLKKGDLSFDTPPLYGKRISLAGVQTLGDLVQRVAEKTGLEIYADRRLNARKVTIVGAKDATPDAADVMKALCYAVAGTVRRVADENGNTVYLLANNQKGLMPVRLWLAEWAGDIDALARTEDDAFSSTTRRNGLIKGVGFGTGMPSLSPQTMARIEERLLSPDEPNQYFGAIPVSISELSPELQQRVKEELGKRTEEMDRQNIYTSFYISTELVASGYGTFQGPLLGSLETLLPRPGENNAPPVPEAPPAIIRLPKRFSTFGGLRIAPTTDAQTDKAVRWAKAHGFQALFVQVSLWDGSAQKRLAHAATVGKANGIKIYATASLLKVPLVDTTKADIAPNNLPRTRNVYGETLSEYAARRKNALAFAEKGADDPDPFLEIQEGDWLDEESESVRKMVTVRLREIVSVPGIDGVSLADVAAPGYNLNANCYVQTAFGGRYGGYNNALRVALIRQQNIDPVDVPISEMLPPNTDSSDEGMIPYFPMESSFSKWFTQASAYHRDKTTGVWTQAATPSSEEYVSDDSGWNLLRRDANRAWAAGVRKNVGLAKGLTVYWESPAEPGSRVVTPWISPWETNAAVPPSKPGRGALLPLTIGTVGTAEGVRAALNADLDQRLTQIENEPYIGVVVDATTLDLDTALPFLDCLKLR